MTTENKALTLASYLPLFSDRDRSFAESLCASEKKYGGWTEKQFYWVQKLIATGEALASPKPATAPKAAISGLASIYTLFDAAAAAGLKKPRVRLANGFSLSLAGPGRNQGMLYLKQGATYFGKIDREGVASRSMGVMSQDWDAALPMVQAFAADPKAAAAAYGFATNNCCFCGKDLTDQESVERGYGPICAKRFGLEHNAAGHMKKVQIAA